MTPYSPFERARRRASRVALYTNLAVALGLVAAFVVFLRPALDLPGMGWTRADLPDDPAVKRLQEFIRIDTSDTGSELAGARFLAEILEAEGLEPTILEMGDGRANLWARIEGDSPETLILHSHLDVEPVTDPSVWTHDPFGGEIDGPWIYGRGAFDMKSVTIAQLEAFLEVHSSGRKPARSVLFLATSGEETGSDLGTRWLLEQRPELFANAWAVLTEGGAIEVVAEGEVKYWGTEIGQKRYVDLILCSDDRELLEAIREDLRERGKPSHAEPPAPVIEEFLEIYGPTRTSPRLQRLLAEPAALARDPALFATAPAPVKSMLRNEIHVFPVRQAEDGPYELKVKVHLVQGADLDAVVAELAPEWLTHGTGRVLRRDEPEHRVSPMDHPVFEGILRFLGERYPGAEAGPIYLPWHATDSRFYRAHGLAAYGFSPFVVPTPEVIRMAGAQKVEERIAMLGYVQGIDVYVDLVAALVS